MKLRIYKTVKCFDSKIGKYNNYKIFINRVPLWISEKEFATQPNLFQVSKNYIDLGKFAQHKFKMVPKQNNKGTFYTLEPRRKNEAIDGVQSFNWQTDLVLLRIENEKTANEKEGVNCANEMKFSELIEGRYPIQLIEDENNISGFLVRKGDNTYVEGLPVKITEKIIQPLLLLAIHQN
jgi:hypothetical protein